MVSRDEIEQFLDRLAADGASWREVEPGFWLVRPGGELGLDIVVKYEAPVVVLRVNVMDLPADKTAESRVSRQLLEWNANDLLHGSYGIQNKSIVLTEALELSHLDFEEFMASYESMTLALAGHLRELAAYREAR